MRLDFSLLVAQLAPTLTRGLEVAAIPKSLPGTYVRYDQLNLCPKITRRSRPHSARDVRPDDITVLAALGDSISAGLVALSSPNKSTNQADQQIVFRVRNRTMKRWERVRDRVRGTKEANPTDAIWREYPGLSYPTGLDPNAISLASIFSHYTNLTGGSIGHHLPVSCASKLCGKGKRDGLNAAVSGSTARNLQEQVTDWLIPRIKEMGVEEDEWKFVNIGIGGNDICSYCLTPDIDIPLEHSPKQFAREIKEAVDHLRLHVPNLIVNIVGLFRISSLYDLKLRSGCSLLPQVPSMGFECSCALLPGPAGDLARKRMDRLAMAYNEAIMDIILDWEEEGDGKLGVMYQPGEAIDLAKWPKEALSEVDCFHPSAEAHQRVGAGFWNRLTLDLDDKAVPIEWQDEVRVRCLGEGDRFPVGQVTKQVCET